MIAPPVPAVPQPIAVHYNGSLPTYAISAGRILYADTFRHRVRLRAKRIGSNAPAITLAAIPVKGYSEIGALAASDERVAFIHAAGVYAGPPSGPFAVVRPSSEDDTFRPFDVKVDGPRLLIGASAPGDVPTYRWTVLEPGQPDRALALPPHAVVSSFAGDRIAYRVVDDPPIVASWRTGAVERRLRRYSLGPTLRADGALAYLRKGVVSTAAPGAAPRRLTAVDEAESDQMAWAGDRLVLLERGGATVIEPDGRRRRLGAGSDDVEFEVVATADAVAWTANDCLIAVAPGAGRADAIGPGPCHRTYLTGDGGLRSTRVRCLAGPGGVCRIELRRRGRVRRLRLPIGRSRLVRGTDGPRGTRIFTVDPGGNRRSFPR